MEEETNKHVRMLLCVFKTSPCNILPSRCFRSNLFFKSVFAGVLINYCEFYFTKFHWTALFFLCTLMKHLLATLSGCLCSCVGVGLLLAVANRECVLTKAQQLPSMMPKWWWSGDTTKLGRAVLIVYYGCERVEEDMQRGAATQHSIS